MREEIIHETYEMIMDKIVKAGHIVTLYGEIINPTNPKHLIVAAYFIAQQEEQEKQAQTNEIWAAIARLK